MPPKPKFTKEELVQAALELTREGGLELVVARNLGKKLNTAPSTIFTHFNSVEEIRQAVIEAARELYNGYVEEGLNMVPPMKGFAVQYIRFAMEESNLYSVLFMNKREGFKYVDFIINEGHYERIIAVAEKDFMLNREQAEFVYHNMWAYAHGIAVMSATGVCNFSLEEISQMLGMACRSFLIGMKVPRDEREGTMPEVGVVMPGSVVSYMTVDRKNEYFTVISEKGECMENSWIYCPVCNNKTRIQVREKTVMKSFPLFCPKCKKETLIDVKENHVVVVTEPDAQTQSR